MVKKQFSNTQKKVNLSENMNLLQKQHEYLELLVLVLQLAAPATANLQVASFGDMRLMLRKYAIK